MSAGSQREQDTIWNICIISAHLNGHALQSPGIEAKNLKSSQSGHQHQHLPVSRVTELLSGGFKTVDICLRQNEYTAFSPCPLFLWASFCLSLSFSIENLSKGASLPWFPTIAQHLKIWSVAPPDQAANTATTSQDTYREAAMCEGKSRRRGGGDESSGHSGYN